MTLPASGSIRSSATGFATESSDHYNPPTQSSDYSHLATVQRRPYDARFMSAPNLTQDERFITGTPKLRHPRFISANHSVRSAKTYNPRPYFRSRRIQKGTIDRPELRERDPRGIWVTLIPLIGFLAGLALVIVLSYLGYASVDMHQYCEVFIDDFSNGFNPNIWTQVVETGGFG